MWAPVGVTLGALFLGVFAPAFGASNFEWPGEFGLYRYTLAALTLAVLGLGSWGLLRCRGVGVKAFMALTLALAMVSESGLADVYCPYWGWHDYYRQMR